MKSCANGLWVGSRTASRFGEAPSPAVPPTAAAAGSSAETITSALGLLLWMRSI